MNNLKWLISQYFRWKNPDPVIGIARLFANLGVVLISPYSLLMIISIESVELPFGFELSAQTINHAALVGFVLIFFSILIGVRRASTISNLSKTIIILHRGMDGMALASPAKDLPTRYKNGKVDYINIPNELPSIQSQFHDIEAIQRDIRQRLIQVDHSNTNLLYCGLAPIPLLFFAGYKLQGRERFEIMDYQRSSQKWTFMDDVDDYEKLKIHQPDNLTSSDIAISIGFSFEVNSRLIRDQLGDDVEIVEMQLDRGPRMDSMLSTEKQNRILKLIVEHLVKLRSDNPQIQKYHLFMSAQGSFTVNFGRHWTTTVLPSIHVYNFDSKINSYAWNVYISHGQTQLHID